MTDFWMPRLIDVSGVLACCGVALSTTFFKRAWVADPHTHTHLPLKKATTATHTPILPRGEKEDLRQTRRSRRSRSWERPTAAEHWPLDPYPRRQAVQTPLRRAVHNPISRAEEDGFTHPTLDSGFTSDVFFKWVFLIAQFCCLLWGLIELVGY
jgi:hypothetical protein